MTKEMVKAKPITLATELQEIENSIELFEARRSQIREALLKKLKAQGVRKLDMVNGDSYIITQRDNVVYKNESSAKAWCLENPEARMKIDSSAVLKVAKIKCPKWMKIEVTEYLRITHKKTQDD